MVIYIKNMVCRRCILAIQKEAEILNIKILNIKLGEIEVDDNTVSPETLFQFDLSIFRLGFERFEDKRSRLVEAIKITIIENLYDSDKRPRKNWSEIIADKLQLEYNYLSNVFSASENITIEQYIIRQNIEKIKELLSYDEMNLNEIAWKLGYNSGAYLSSQFKKYTGLTPGQYRKHTEKQRNTIDNILNL
jgi:AraC family transcriptional regulator